MKAVTHTTVPARHDSQDGVDDGRPLLLALFTRPMADVLCAILQHTAPVERFDGDAHALLARIAQPPARWLLLPPAHGDDLGIGPVVLRLSAIDPIWLAPWITIVLSDSPERGRDVLEAVRAGASVVRLAELPDLVKSRIPPSMSSSPRYVYARDGTLADTMENLDQTLAFLVRDPVAFSIVRAALETRPSAETGLPRMSPDAVRRHLRARGLPPPSTLSAWSRLLRAVSMCAHGHLEEASARACGFSSSRTMRRTARRLLRCDDLALPPWQIDQWIGAFHRHVVLGVHAGGARRQHRRR